MSCSCRKKAAWLSRSAKIATSTLAPVTSSRPDDCTWITARWMTRWKPAVGLESSGTVGDEVFEFGIDVGDEIAAQLVEIDIAGPHHRRGILIVDQREQQMLERGVFVVALVGQREGAMQRPFEATGKCWHMSHFVPVAAPAACDASSVNLKPESPQYFPSISSPSHIVVGAGACAQSP